LTFLVSFGFSGAKHGTAGAAGPGAFPFAPGPEADAKRQKNDKGEVRVRESEGRVCWRSRARKENQVEQQSEAKDSRKEARQSKGKRNKDQDHQVEMRQIQSYTRLRVPGVFAEVMSLEQVLAKRKEENKAAA